MLRHFPYAGYMERLNELRERVRAGRERWEDSRLGHLIPPSPALHPAPTVAIWLLVLGALLVFIGSFLPWVETSIPAFADPEFGSMSAREFTDSGLERSGGLVALAYTLVLLVLASFLWRVGLSDWRGILLPFLAAIPLIVAVLEIGDTRDVVFRATEGGPDLGRIERSVKPGLFVVAVGGTFAVMGGLRVSRAAQHLRKQIEKGEQQAWPPRRGRRG